MSKIAAFLPALLAALLLAACGGAQIAAPPPGAAPQREQITVGFSQVGAESDWRAANTKSMADTFTEQAGYRLIFEDARQKQDNQISALRNFIHQEVDYIVLAPISETGWETVLSEAKSAGIPVILVDRMIDVADDSLYTCWVGSDFRKEGDAAVAWMERRFRGRDSVNIVHLQGTPGSSAQLERSRSLAAGAAANPGWRILVQEAAWFTEAKARELMAEALAQHSDIDLVYCENDNMAFGAIAAIEAAGRTPGGDGGIAVVSFDATTRGLILTLDGKISFNAECNPLHGPRVEALIHRLEAGETPEKHAYVAEQTFDAATITPADIDARAY